MRLSSRWTVGLLVWAARSRPAQAIGQGFELERAGQYEQAAAIYLAALRAEPTNLPALLGLERVLPPLSRLGELLPVAQRAATASPTNTALRGVLLRTYVALNEPDSARAVALRWAAAAPCDEAPYREWAMALEDTHRHAAARDVLLAGRRFADIAGTRSTPDARRVRALALARYADLASGPGGGAARARAEAARAFIEAGDRAAARAVLERVARDSTAPPDAQRLAQHAVVEALIDAGQLDTAAQQLATNSRLSAEDRASLRLRLARARIGAGALDRAESALADDSSVEALALQGWIALYRGRLRDAQTLFRAAGPYAGDRSDATERTAMLALLQQVPADSFPELGGALLLLARGDSTRAAAALRLAAGRLST